MLLYKEDWKEAKERFGAWWEKELNRPLMQIFAPKSGSEAAEWDIWSFLKYWGKPDVGIRGFEDWCQNVFFGGEAYPNLWVNLGPCVCAAHMGADAQFRSGTVWYETSIPWEEVQNLDYSPHNKWWLYTKDITIKACKAGRDRFIVGLPDLGAVTDIAASLRGHKDLIVDFYRNQDKVRRLSEKISEVWFRVYDELHTIVMSYGQEGTSSWMGLWCPKRWYPIHADFAYMLSPSKFKQLVLPFLEDYCLRLDYTIYHLDGIGQIPHLDLLLSIDELTGIQWVPGAGQRGLEDPRWLPLYKKVQKSGKNLVLHGVALGGVSFLLKNLKPQGLALSTDCSTETEARRLLKETERCVNPY